MIKKGVICLYERGKKRAMAALASICMVLMLLTPQAHAQSGERTVIPLGKAVGIKLFAEGALTAAAYLAGQPAGLYDMKNLIGDTERSASELSAVI